MKIIIRNLSLIIAVIGSLYSQQSFSLSEDKNAAQSSTLGLQSNVINCIALQGDKTTWIGTGQGVAVMYDSVFIYSLDTMQIFNEDPRFIFDSIASMSTQDSSLTFANVISINGDPAGSGIFYTENGLSDQIEWYRFDQPIDTTNDTLATFGFGYFKARPLVGTRGVVTYSMDIENNYLWITSWYGGLRRLNLGLLADWERIPLPLDDVEELITCDQDAYNVEDGNLILNDYYWDSSDPDGNHNHKAFSVLVYSDTIWVGTANGINRGIIGENDCVDWKHYFHPNDNISGNWVLDIAKQEQNGTRIIWAITVNAILESEKQGVSFTTDDGATWATVDTLSGIRCNDISILGSTVLIASDEGLWRSNDRENWELIPPAVKATPVSSDEILSNTAYAVAGDDRVYFENPIVWIGTPDGLARSYNSVADNWEVYRAVSNKDEIYAYPNPFSPYSHNQLGDDGWVRFNIGETQFEKVNLYIYNFALQKVYSEEFDWQINPGAVKWNGRDKKGELVANGVYFINIKIYEDKSDDGNEHWIKLVVVK